MVTEGQMIMMAGIWLRQNNKTISAKQLQKEISLMPDGYNPPLKQCESVLEYLKLGGFLEEKQSGVYSISYGTVIVQEKKSADIHSEKVGTGGINPLQNPLWAGNI